MILYLHGHVLLQGRPNPPDPHWAVPVSGLFLPTGLGLPIYFAGITDESGYFTVTLASAVPPGTYQWWVKNTQTLANGGSVAIHPQTLAKAVATIKDVDTVITGHIPIPTTWNELKEYADFTQDFVTWAQNEMKAGKTVDQAVPEYKVPAKYRGYVASANPQFGGVKPNLEALYKELKK